jgi:hypothetical protein
MSKRRDAIERERQAKVRDALAHYAHITFTRDGQTMTARVKWYGYPPSWVKFDGQQRVEWWRQHAVRMYAMPIDAQLIGVEIRCEGCGL